MPTKPFLPFYILHHSVILLVGAYVVKWGGGVGTKFFMIAVVSMAIIMAIYELVVRRIYILRFLFGMKWKKVGAAQGWSRGSSRAVSTGEYISLGRRKIPND